MNPPIQSPVTRKICKKHITGAKSEPWHWIMSPAAIEQVRSGVRGKRPIEPSALLELKAAIFRELIGAQQRPQVFTCAETINSRTADVVGFVGRSGLVVFGRLKGAALVISTAYFPDSSSRSLVPATNWKATAFDIVRKYCPVISGRWTTNGPITTRWYKPDSNHQVNCERNARRGVVLDVLFGSIQFNEDDTWGFHEADEIGTFYVGFPDWDLPVYLTQADNEARRERQQSRAKRATNFLRPRCKKK